MIKRYIVVLVDKYEIIFFQTDTRKKVTCVGVDAPGHVLSYAIEQQTACKLTG